MTKIIQSLFILTTLILLLSLSPQTAVATGDEIVIITAVAGTDITQLTQDHQALLLQAVPPLSLYRLQGDNLAATLANDSRVLSIQGDGQLESRPYFVDAMGNTLSATVRYIDATVRYIDATVRYIDATGNEIGDPYQGQMGADLIRLLDAHTISKGQGIIVAVLDSGADLDHPLLVDNIIAGYDFVDDDSDPSEVLDGIDNDNDGHIDEAGGHGTHVAGIVRLTAPEAQIMPIRIFNTEGAGTYFHAAQGIVYAVDNGAHVINLSGNGDTHSNILQAAIEYAWQHGVLVVAAAGANSVGYPSQYPEVISVGAVEANDYRAEFAHFPSVETTVYAPGHQIFSAYLDGNLAEWSGNSMAAPFVAGEVALMRATGNCDALCAFNGVATAVRPIHNHPNGNGRIDLYDAVSLAAGQFETHVIVQYYPGTDDTPDDEQVLPRLNLLNQANSIPLNELTLRYWYETNDIPQTFICDYALIGCDQITAIFSQTDTNHTYVDFQFNSDDTLYGGTESGELQFRIHQAGWQLYDETAHYTYAPFTDYTDWAQVALYHHDTLIWGIDPDGAAANTSWYTPTLPAPPPQSASTITAQYKTLGTTAVTNQIYPDLQIENGSNNPIPLNELTLRYWLPETANAHFACDYALIGCDQITATFNNDYLELSFPNTPQLLESGDSSGEIKFRIHQTDWANFDQANHHSFNPNYNTYTDWENITIYHQGNLIWGTEP